MTKIDDSARSLSTFLVKTSSRTVALLFFNGTIDPVVKIG